MQRPFPESVQVAQSPVSKRYLQSDCHVVTGTEPRCRIRLVIVICTPSDRLPKVLKTLSEWTLPLISGRGFPSMRVSRPPRSLPLIPVGYYFRYLDIRQCAAPGDRKARYCMCTLHSYLFCPVSSSRCLCLPPHPQTHLPILPPTQRASLATLRLVVRLLLCPPEHREATRHRSMYRCPRLLGYCLPLRDPTVRWANRR